MSNDKGLAPGSAFGNYEIVRALGEGGFGGVYEALRLPLRRRVALKVLHREHLDNPEVLARFVREAEAAARFNHPHIADTHDVGQVDGVPYLAMEYLDGESLASRIEKGGALPLTETADVMVPICLAVQAIHEQGVIHRDLKPDNIFLVRQGSVTVPKLIDFGIAKVTDASAQHSRTNMLVGTPWYMSPEQASDSKHIDSRSDVWALGVITYECLTGVRPFGGDSALGILIQVTQAEIPSPRGSVTDLPDEVEATVMHAMTRALPERCATARELAAALLPFAGPLTQARWAQDLGGVVPAPRPSRTSAAPVVPRNSVTDVGTAATLEPSVSPLAKKGGGSRRTAWIGLGGGLIVLAVVAGAIGLRSPPPATPAAPQVRPAVVPAPPVAAPVVAPAQVAAQPAQSPDAGSTGLRSPFESGTISGGMESDPVPASRGRRTERRGSRNSRRVEQRDPMGNTIY